MINSNNNNYSKSFILIYYDLCTNGIYSMMFCYSAWSLPPYLFAQFDSGV